MAYILSACAFDTYKQVVTVSRLQITCAKKVVVVVFKKLLKTYVSQWILLLDAGCPFDVARQLIEEFDARDVDEVARQLYLQQ